MYYAQELIEEIRMQNDILDVVSEYVQLKKKGTSYFGLCPFHNEKTSSFSVSADKQIFYCFGCGAGGNVISFVMQIENYDFVEAIKYLASRVHIQLPEPQYSEEAKKYSDMKKKLLDIHKQSARYFYYNLHTQRGQVGLKYINQRKITIKFQKKFGLGYSNYSRKDLYKYLLNKGYSDELICKSGLVIPQKNKEEFFDRFGNRIMFPIFDVHNNIIAFGGRIIGEGQPKYLNSPETLIFDKGKNLYALNIARTSKKKQFIIVEGYIDVIALHQAGFTNAVATLGTAFSVEQSRLLKKYSEEVIILYDSDEAGTNAILRAIPILVSSGLKVKVVQLKGAKDPDEYINKYGKEEFEDILKNASGYIDFQINHIESKYNLKDTQAKVKFGNEVLKLLATLDNAIEQDAYIKQTALLYNLSEEAMRKEISKIILKKDESNIVLKPKNLSKPILKYSNENIKIQKGVLEAQKTLLNIISNNEAVYHIVKQYLTPKKFIEPCFQILAQKIYELCNKKINIYPAELINYFETPEEQRLITEIFAVSIEYNSNLELEKALNDQVKLILKTHIDIMSRQSDDIKQIQQLIEDKRNVDNLNITLTDG